MEDYITLETSKLAKEKNYNEYCEKGYYKYELIDKEKVYLLWSDALGYGSTLVGYAPKQHELQKWLREKHGIHILIIPTVTAAWTYKTVTVISERDNDVIVGIKSVDDLPPYKNVCGEDFNTYEDALESALKNSLNQIQ